MSARPDSPPGAPPAPPSLLGWYQRPALHLIGGPLPPGPQPPARWVPAPPPLQHGIDYAFARRDGTRPVTWPADALITLRLAGSAPPGTSCQEALAIVTAELRELTGLSLAAGQPAAAPLDPLTVPAREIHVGYLPGPAVLALPGWCSGGTVQGGAVLRETRAYAAGYAAVSTDCIGAAATTAAGLGILRHALAHALGLGHARRRAQLMSECTSGGPASFQRGDQHGLALLGPGRAPAGAHPPGCPPTADRQGDTPSCAPRPHP